MAAIIFLGIFWKYSLAGVGIAILFDWIRIIRAARKDKTEHESIVIKF